MLDLIKVTGWESRSQCDVIWKCWIQGICTVPRIDQKLKWRLKFTVRQTYKQADSKTINSEQYMHLLSQGPKLSTDTTHISNTETTVDITVVFDLKWMLRRIIWFVHCHFQKKNHQNISFKYLIIIGNHYLETLG